MSFNFITDLTLEQTDTKKVKAEDKIDGKSSEINLRINQLRRVYTLNIMRIGSKLICLFQFTLNAR